MDDARAQTGDCGRFEEASQSGSARPAAASRDEQPPGIRLSVRERSPRTHAAWW
jgi:hypothetical protein